MKLKNEEKAKLCYMDMDSCMDYIKIDIFTDMSKVFETRFGTSNCGLDRPLPKEK